MLQNNSIPFRVYNEKFRGATYIIVFDGVCNFNFQKILEMLRASPYLELRSDPRSVTIQKLPVIADDPVTVVKFRS